MGTEFKIQGIVERITDDENMIVGWVYLNFNQEDKKEMTCLLESKSSLVAVAVVLKRSEIWTNREVREETGNRKQNKITF